LTPSISITPSITSTPPCTCYNFEIVVTQQDLDAATGNTGGLSGYNGIVYMVYTDCDSILQEITYNTAGTYYLCACTAIDPQYYQNNSPNTGTSTTTNIGNCNT
jgi:hypothetical protein